VGAHVLAVAQQLDGLNEEVVEVEGVVVDEALFVEAEDAGDCRALLVVRLDAGGVQLRVEAAVLGVADGPLGLSRREALVVVAEVFDAALDDARRVVLVVDGEGARVPGLQLLDVAAEHTDAKAVEGRDERRALKALVAQELPDALAHLLRGLVGEGDGEDVVGRDAALGDEVGDADGDDARLA
jgi:hypothetical protein